MKVGLLGDSIRLLGYGTVIKDYLGEDYEVFQPEDNGRFAKYTLRMLFDYKEQLKDCDVIHWNNGLWDVTDILGDGKLFTSDEEYVDNMTRIARKLLQITPKVIFATTTPVRFDNPYNKNENIERFNALLVPKFKEMGITINDLYSTVAKDINANIREDDKIHLTEKAIHECAKQVAEIIKNV